MSVAEELLGPFAGLLRGISTAEAIRQAENAQATTAIWEAIEESGFTDALISEERGGAGLSLADVHPLFVACGEHLLPPAFGQTMLARALLSSSGQSIPSEAIVLWPQSPGGELRSLLLPAACEGTWALTQLGPTMELRRLRALSDCVDGYGLVPAVLDLGAPLLRFDVSSVDLLDYAATCVAAHMAGAMARMVEMSLAFASERRQFGRALSAFQTIQHQLSVAGEQAVLATTASRIAFATNSLAMDPLRAAVAKVIANDAATVVCSVAHAVHGAIGISKEHDLQLYSRRLRRWQISFGSSEFWARRVGSARLSDKFAHGIDFIRAMVEP